MVVTFWNNAKLVHRLSLGARVLVGFGIAFALVCFGACGGSTGAGERSATATKPTAPAATPTQKSFTLRYSLIGMVNGQAAQGSLVLVSAGGEPNLVRFSITSFAIGNIQAMAGGTAEFFTLDNSFTMTVTVSVSGQGDVELTGRGWANEHPKSIRDVTLSGGGFAVTFSASEE